MPMFRVLVHGTNMTLRRWVFFRRRLNFYATRFVEADTAAGAGARALELLRGEPQLAFAAVEEPQLAVEEVEETDPSGFTAPQPGIVFYSGGTKSGIDLRAT